MNLVTRKDFFNCETNINTKEIYKTSRLVSTLTSLLVQPNKAIVGANAFAHEAGIHQAGVLRARETYEIMKPEDIGLTESRLVLGKHSGRNAFADRLKDMGYNIQDEALEKAFAKFKEIADKKKDVTERDLEAIVANEAYVDKEFFSIESIEVESGTSKKPKATVVLKHESKIISETSTGAGPVDAVYSAIDKIVQQNVGAQNIELVDYIIQAITGGTDAQGEVKVRIKDAKDNIYAGHGSDTDIIIASAKAYLSAINRLLFTIS